MVDFDIRAEDHLMGNFLNRAGDNQEVMRARAGRCGIFAMLFYLTYRAIYNSSIRIIRRRVATTGLKLPTLLQEEVLCAPAWASRFDSVSAVNLLSLVAGGGFASQVAQMQCIRETNRVTRPRRLPRNGLPQAIKQGKSKV